MNLLPSLYVTAVVAIGCFDPETGVGGLRASATVVEHDAEVYLATANHVVAACGDEVIGVGYEGRIVAINGEILAQSNDGDIAVIRWRGERPGEAVSRLRYGAEGTLLGAIGRAVGFPHGVEEHLTEWGGWPVPLQVPVTIYGGGGDEKVTGGYINAGFSGGAVMAPTGPRDTDWTIAGIITDRGHVLRRPVDKDGEELVVRSIEGEELWVREPNGLVYYTGMRRVFELIDQARADEAGDADSGQAKGARMRPLIRGPGAGPWLPR